MFERFSEKARRVVFFARYEASQFGSPVIDTEHLLLGVLRESADLIASLAGVDANKKILEEIRQQRPVREKISTSVDLPFSEAGKRTLNYALDEADQLNSREITPKHILLGLLREENCLAQKILSGAGVVPDSARHYEKLSKSEKKGTLVKGVTGMPVPDESFQKAVKDAMEEARRLRSLSAKPEHLLLALLRDDQSSAARILKEAGLDYDGVRKKLE